ncbi:RNA polymerase sigma factor [Robertmurraya kyonggiensis]|uniref:Sigma-70 family RNA polymerase sigma factor n=1 Tax=Robertmurraya kyonggiensis TaxID=1037680 RepID=A0A4U1D9C6_9BACI|nr:sigma-70 family RNA polymerase sigma factor [Robertmurraya kyonggiensis]TKC19034.1 sigma-70 family RNA polymerase sigma factor [Robertmurraya kyonggiensis]
MIDNIQETQFDTIVQMYSPELKKLAWSFTMDPYLAEDIVQEVMLKCYLHQEQLEGLRSVRAWLYTITKNQCKDYLRGSYHQRVTPTCEFFLANQVTPESEMLGKQSCNEVYEQIESLPVIYQEVLYLSCVKDLKMKEIQQHLDINISTVKTRLFRAKHLLKAAMN